MQKRYEKMGKAATDLKLRLDDMPKLGEKHYDSAREVIIWMNELQKVFEINKIPEEAQISYMHKVIHYEVYNYLKNLGMTTSPIEDQL